MANDILVQATAVVGSVLTVAGTIYVAWIGYRGKGKDTTVARDATNWDNLQKEVVRLSAVVVQERARADAERDRADQYHSQLIAGQDGRHDLKSMVRALLAWCREKGFPREDIEERARALDA